MSQIRICSKCSKEFPLTYEFFGKNVSSNTPGKNKQYFRPECKECNKKRNQGQKEAYKLAGKPKRPAIGTPCDLCNRTDMKLVFDHDHKTLEHRGWLCENCNQGLGRLGDTEESLQRALNYLKKSKNP
jgi:hypothetical protein